MGSSTATAIGGAAGGATLSGLSGGNPLLGAVTGFVAAGGLGGGIFGGFGFNFGNSAAGIFAAEAANVSTRGFLVGTLGSLASGEKFSDALKHGLISAGVHLGGVTVNNLIGHAAGFIASGGQAPRIEQGVFVYEANVRQAFAIGNVITGSRGSLAQTATVAGIPTSYSVLQHEIGHFWQSGVLGVSYLPFHGLFQGASRVFCGSTHTCNPLERWLHPYPSY